jgi:hypothetical protein
LYRCTEEAKEMFDKFDVDGSGKLEVKELHSVLQKLGLEIPIAQFEAYSGAILKNYDKNTNAALDFSEFSRFYSKCLASEDVRKRYAKKLAKDVGGPATKAAAEVGGLPLHSRVSSIGYDTWSMLAGIN